jgi:hypothetical protein
MIPDKYRFTRQLAWKPIFSRSEVRYYKSIILNSTMLVVLFVVNKIMLQAKPHTNGDSQPIYLKANHPMRNPHNKTTTWRCEQCYLILHFLRLFSVNSCPKITHLYQNHHVPNAK